jgi:MFS family permease
MTVKDPIYSAKERVSQVSAKRFHKQKKLIPSDRKGVFITLFFAIFTTITGVGIVVPLLPIYANDLGATGIYVGLIFGSFSISRTFLLPVFGRLSDQKGRKPFIVTGVAAYTLVSIGFLFSKNVETLILLRFFQGAGSAMVLPVVQAYVGEITPKGSEGYSMGLFNLSMFLSLSLGPLMGGVIKDIWSLNAAFMGMGSLSGIGLLLCIFLLPPTSQEKIDTAKKKIVPWSMLIKDRGIISLFIFRYAYTSCIGVIWCFLPLFADKEFGLSGSLTGVLVMLGVFVSGILQLPMGYIADRSNKNIMIVCGGILSSIGILLPLWASSFQDLLIAVLIFGIGGGISMPAIMAHAVIIGNAKKAMGSVMSIVTVGHSLGMMTGSMAAGFTMDYFSLRLSFPCGTLIMAAGTLVFWLIVDRNSFAKD